MTRFTLLAGSLALVAAVTALSVHRSDAQDGPRPIPPNLTSYLVPFRQLYDLEKSFPRWPLPESSREYAAFDGVRIKRDVEAVAAISRRSHDSGEQYWGRIAGSQYEAATRKWMADRFRELGISDVREQPVSLSPQWWPSKWSVSQGSSGQGRSLGSAFPFLNSPGTPSGGVELDVAYVGLGRAADFAGRNVRGKAALIFSTPAPGVRDHSAEWFGAIERAQAEGAAAVLVVLGLPGNLTSIMRSPTRVPAFSLGQEDGASLMDLVDRAGSGTVKVRIALDVATRSNLSTGTVWATLNGTTDEDIVIIAHTDGYFEGATDNASGMATLLALAEFYAKQPAASRRRTLRFAAIPAHHAGDPAARWMHEQRATMFAKTALILNIEHTSTMEVYLHGPYLRRSNMVGAKRWAVYGSPALEQLLVRAFDTFGVTTYAEPDANAGGAMAAIRNDAPSFMFNDASTYYHTTADTSAVVPAPGLEASARAFASIIDQANELSRQELAKEHGAK
jgi:hypothetical protein